MNAMRVRRGGVPALVALAAAVLLSVAIGGSRASVGADGSVTGQWLLDALPGAGGYQLSLEARDSWRHFATSASVPADALRGFTAAAAGSVVRFQIVRDAGTFDCEGWFKADKGAGTFVFTPSAGYLASLGQLGLTDARPEDQLRLAVLDVSLAYIRGMKAEGLGATASDFARLRSHGVDVGYARAIASVGYAKLEAVELVRFKNHDITLEYIRDLASAGVARVEAGELVRLRNHDITAATVRGWTDAGYAGLGSSDLVRLRNHDVTPEFARELRALGYETTASDLVRLKNHGVTVEFVRDLDSRGLRGLSIQDLIRLRRSGASGHDR